MKNLPMPRICTVCDKPYAKKPKEAAYTFERRRFCSQECSRSAMKKGVTDFMKTQQL